MSFTEAAGRALRDVARHGRGSAGGAGHDEELYFADLPYVADPGDPRLAARRRCCSGRSGSTEPHGPHSPLATDPIISIGICRARRAPARRRPELKVLDPADALLRRHALHRRLRRRDPRERGDAARRSSSTSAPRSRARASRTSCSSTTTSSPSTCRRSIVRSTTSRRSGHPRRLPRPDAQGARAAADRGVQARRVPRGPLRDLARARAGARARRPRGDGGASSTCRSACRGDRGRAEGLPRHGPRAGVLRRARRGDRRGGRGDLRDARRHDDRARSARSSPGTGGRDRSGLFGRV